jgi:hypothetical protein
MVVCTILGSAKFTIVYLLWIRRERHGGKFLTAHVVCHALSIMLRVTCQCTIGGRNMSKLSIWILEDYGTNNKWTLKHNISLHKLFG